jgi:LAO/AO transport system kinase
LNPADDRRPERRAEALEMLSALEREAPYPGSPRIGITGAPGAGKSTLLDALVRSLRADDETVALVAIDPSSQTSGGALLGDRIRVRAGSGDRGVFIRSMAARDRLGGIADAAWAGVAILAAVFDRVFVETVGVGQSESDVVPLVDTLVFVANPGSGDELQYMKAGLLELPDVFVVSKADLGAVARRTASELESARGLAQRRPGGWEPPVLLVSGRDGSGTRELLEALDAHRAHALASGALAERRRRGSLALVETALHRRYGSFGLERIGGRRGIEERISAEPERSSFAWVDALSREIEDALRKPA